MPDRQSCTPSPRSSYVLPCEGGWLVDLRPAGGPVLVGPEGEPFLSGQAALEAERAWLRDVWGL